MAAKKRPRSKRFKTVYLRVASVFNFSRLSISRDVRRLPQHAGVTARRKIKKATLKRPKPVALANCGARAMDDVENTPRCAAVEPSQTVKEFCVSERMSRSMLYILWEQGIGPDYFCIGRTKRISPEAKLAWRRAREAAAKAKRQGKAAADLTTADSTA
jgi:hypothetical protein